MIIKINNGDKIKLEQVLDDADIDFSFLDDNEGLLFNSVLNVIDLDGTIMKRVYMSKAKDMIESYCDSLGVSENIRLEYLQRLDSLAETFAEYSLWDETILESLTEEFLTGDECVIDFNSFTDVNSLTLHLLRDGADFTSIYNTLVNNIEEMLDCFDISEEDLKVEIIDALYYCGYGFEAVSKFEEDFDLLIA